MKKFVLTSLTALIMTSIAIPSQAALLAYNGFDGNLTGFDTSAVPVDGSGGLSYTDSSGNILDTVAGASSNFFQANMSGPTFASSGTIYGSFLTSSLGADLRFRFDFVDDTNTGAVIGSQFSAPDVGSGVIASGSLFFPFGGSLIGSASGTNLYVFALDLDSGSLSAWYNPDLAAPGAADHSFTNAANLAGISVEEISLVFGGDLTSGFIFDEVRLGNSFADVTPFTPIPEPTSAALVLGGLGLLACRRRR